MPTETRPRTGFPKNKLYMLAQKYKANFYHRKNLSFNSGMLLLLLLLLFILTLRSIVYIESMDANNLTMVTEFILMGFTDYHMLEIPLFLTFLIFYIVTLLGNVGMIILIQVDVQLHMPMYFFLSHLALLDACYASVITPQILATLATGKMVISYGQCATQFFFFTFCAGTECFLLAVMAYDRYAAVSNPLLYTVAMNPRICWSLVVEAYVCGMLGSIVRTTCTFTLSFCDHNQINFFFCDLPPLLKLACNDTTNTEIVIVFFGNFVILANALVILISYLLIIKAILKVKSRGGKAKTFCTCASHLTAVALFFGTLIFMYQRSGSGKSLEEDKVVSVFYTVVIPMLNPLIYSLRNKDVKAAFRKVTGRLQVSLSV
ncbi:olfactory receptor 9I1-like [Panthera tigris]|uniref:olfactory receptor 9I1-like n=1 Tax=Panthera tigris TaxID=9694 RepID=UPI001C6F8883|nr:olfactory receptor 9I1-like [Panthera tigris]XP_042814344.1 olfactory receptor 9I1-like [Panthera tigris]